MQPKADIKWFELFFDILIVVGISNVVFMVNDQIHTDGIYILIKAIVIILILFNAWMRVVFLENKIKVIEIKLDSPIHGYKIQVMLQFFLLFILIFLFTASQFNIQNILIVYLLLLLINTILYEMRLYNIFLIALLMVLSFVYPEAFLIRLLFGLFVVKETIITYSKIEHKSNSIFRDSKFKPRIKFENEDIKLPDPSLCMGKIYIPHVMERLGIVMIVFMAELMLVLLDVTHKSEYPIYFATLVFAYLLLFYMDFFSILEHYDERLLHMDDKKKKYPKAKKTIYLSVLYYISIILMTLFIKDFSYMQNDMFTLGCALMSYLIFECANIILLNMYDDINIEHKTYYYLIKVISIALVVIAFFMGSNIILLISIVIALTLNVIGSRYNKVVHRFN